QRATVYLDGVRGGASFAMAYVRVQGMSFEEEMMRQSSSRYSNIRVRVYDSTVWRYFGNDYQAAQNFAFSHWGLAEMRPPLNMGTTINWSILSSGGRVAQTSSDLSGGSQEEKKLFRDARKKALELLANDKCKKAIGGDKNVEEAIRLVKSGKFQVSNGK